MDNVIIAFAVVDFVLHFSHEQDGSNGACLVKKETIKTFKPITKEEFQDFIPEFKSFNQVKQRLYIEKDKLELLEKRMMEK